jgi:hypothetical protein
VLPFVEQDAALVSAWIEAERDTGEGRETLPQTGSKDWHIATSAIRAALACRRKVEVEVDLKKDGTGTMVFRAFWQKPGTHKPKTEAAPKPE